MDQSCLRIDIWLEFNNYSTVIITSYLVHICAIYIVMGNFELLICLICRKPFGWKRTEKGLFSPSRVKKTKSWKLLRMMPHLFMLRCRKTSQGSWPISKHWIKGYRAPSGPDLKIWRGGPSILLMPRAPSVSISDFHIQVWIGMSSLLHTLGHINPKKCLLKGQYFEGKNHTSRKG